MPFLPFDDEEKKRQEAEASGQNISGPGSSSFQSNNTSVAAPKPLKSSGSWTNLNQYLDANKEQSQNMANALVQSTDDKLQSSKTNLNNLQQNKVVEKSDSDFQKIYNGPINAQTTQEYNNLKQGVVPTLTDSDIPGLSDEKNKKASLQNEASFLDSEEGRQSRLGEVYKRPSYNLGQKSLDNYLLGQSDARNMLNQKRNDWNSILSLFDTTKDRLQQDAQAKANLTKAKLTPEYELQQIQNRKAQIENRKNEIPMIRERVREDMRDNYTIDSEEAARELGLDVGQSLPGDFDWRGYYNAPSKPVNELSYYDLVGKKEAEQMKALDNLMGTNQGLQSQTGQGIFDQDAIRALLGLPPIGGN